MNIRAFKRLGPIVALAVLCASVAGAQPVPQSVNFQGRLKDSSGNPINGVQSFVFKIFDASAGGNLLWNETQASVVISTGLYNVSLGSVVPISSAVFAGPAAYLEITVGADPAMTPRLRFQTSPYAFNADTLQGRDYQALVSTDAATQSIAGNKTFTGTISVPAPVAAGHAATKGYVDAQVTAGSGWSLTGNVAELNNPGNNVVVQSTLTVQGSAFSVGGSTLVAVGGNVGIGTVNPTSIFHVIGNTSATSFQFQGNGANANPALSVKALPGAGHAQVFIDRADTGAFASLKWLNGGAVQWTLDTPDFTSGDATRLDMMNSANITRMTFLQSGNVGIGTVTPALLLDVNGGTIFRSSSTWAGVAAPPVSAAGQGAIYFDSGSNQFQVSQNAGAYIPLVPPGAGAWLPLGAMVELTNPGNNVVVQSTLTVQGNAFSVGGSTLVVTSGKVGIGTAAPIAELHALGNFAGGIMQNLRAENTSATGGASVVLQGSANALNLYMLGGSYAPSFQYQPNVGLLETTSNGLNLSSIVNANANIKFWTSTTGNGNLAMLIDSAQRVGIGTPIPQTPLDVNGAAQFGAGAAKSTFTALGNLLVPGNVGIGVTAPIAPLITNGNSGTGLGASFSGLSGTGPGFILNIGNNVATGASVISFSTGAGGGNAGFVEIYDPTVPSLVLKGGGGPAQVMINSATGNTGIGNLNAAGPNVPLHVIEPAGFVGDLFKVSTGTINMFRVNSNAPSVYGLGAYTAAGGSADVAEMFEQVEPMEVGDLVYSAGGKRVSKSPSGPESFPLGIVSGNPGVRLGWDSVASNEMPNHQAIALSGRVPVKVSAENGSIKVGDYLAPGSRPGYAMRATQSGRVIGVALEAFDGRGSDDGQILCFVNPQAWVAPRSVVDMQDYESLKAEVRALRERLDGMKK